MPRMPQLAFGKPSAVDFEYVLQVLVQAAVFSTNQAAQFFHGAADSPDIMKGQPLAICQHRRTAALQLALRTVADVFACDQRTRIAKRAVRGHVETLCGIVP